MNDARSVLMAGIVGAAVGAGVALLLAPCSGKQARVWLMDETRAIKDGERAALELARERIEYSEAGDPTVRG